MRAIFYNFSKKVNSTAIPNGGEEKEIYLKEETSILSPRIEIVGNSIYPTYTYVYIPEFSRYYFIVDKQANNGVWELQCDEDRAASFRSNILNLTTFVERSASTYDIDIPDMNLSSKQFIASSESVNKTVGFNTTGCFIVRVASNASKIAPTGVEMYALTTEQLGTLISYMYNADNFVDVLSESFAKLLFNPLDYIISVKWFPFSVDRLSGVNTSIWVGWWDTGISGKLLSNFGGVLEFTFEPFARYFNDWRDRSPLFTKFELYVPSYGVVSIPPEMLYNGNGLGLLCSVDFSTGQFTTFINSGGDDVSSAGVLTSLTGMIGYDVQISQLTTNIAGIAQAATSYASANDTSVGGAIVDAVHAITTPTIRSIGSSGAIQGFLNRPWFTLSRYVYGSTEYPTTVAGRPLMRNAKLGDLSGFVKCGNASISIDGLESEREYINQMLNTGIFIE